MPPTPMKPTDQARGNLQATNFAKISRHEIEVFYIEF